MASLVQSGGYVAINKTDTATDGFYIIMFTSEAYTLQDNITIYGQIITAGELFFRAQYICSTQEITNWFRDKNLQQKVTIVRTWIILHP